MQHEIDNNKGNDTTKQISKSPLYDAKFNVSELLAL